MGGMTATAVAAKNVYGRRGHGGYARTVLDSAGRVGTFRERCSGPW
jgi:hypothetical protein